jgi:hypothetical protein
MGMDWIGHAPHAIRTSTSLIYLVVICPIAVITA